MSICKYLTAASLATALSVSIASAATFTIDSGDVTVSGADFCVRGDCKLTGKVKGGSFDLNTVGETATVSDLFNWKVATTHPWATGAGGYSVNVTLNFSSPSSTSTNGSGYAGFVTLLGSVSGGVLGWTSGSGIVDFADGYRLSYALEDAAKLGFGKGATTGASFTLEEAAAPAPVPLPASALLLLGGMGVLGGIRAKRRRAA
jgi:hypothetical protein